MIGLGFTGPTYFSRTTDGGQSWEPAREIYHPSGNNQTIGNQIVVLPDGTLVNGFNLINNFKNKAKDRGLNVAIQRSTDKGVTWSTPIVASKLLSIGVTDPQSGQDVRTGDILPDFAVDRGAGPARGNLYAVWQDARFSGGEHDSIAFAQSTDGGLTWSTPIQVNKTPTGIASANQQAFTASVLVASNSTIGVTYYDFRNNDGDAELETDYFIVHCHPTAATTCANATNWGAELRLTDASFDMTKAPFARGFFVGDYEGLSASGNLFLTFFSQPHGSDPASIFFRKAGP